MENLKEIRSSVGANLKVLRKERAVSQAELARILNVSQPQLSLLENGKASLSAEQLFLLAKKFSKPLEEFFLLSLKTHQDSFFVNDRQLQAALYFNGASYIHLPEDEILIDRYKSVENIIFDVLSYYSDSPRFILALAVVVIRMFRFISFSSVSIRFSEVGLQPVWMWFVESLLLAIRARRSNEALSVRFQNRYRYAEKFLLNHFVKASTRLKFSTEGQLFENVVFQNDDSIHNSLKVEARTPFLSFLELGVADWNRYTKSLQCDEDRLFNWDKVAEKWCVFTRIRSEDFIEHLILAEEEDA